MSISKLNKLIKAKKSNSSYFKKEVETSDPGRKRITPETREGLKENSIVISNSYAQLVNFSQKSIDKVAEALTYFDEEANQFKISILRSLKYAYAAKRTGSVSKYMWSVIKKNGCDGVDEHLDKLKRDLKAVEKRINVCLLDASCSCPTGLLDIVRDTLVGVEVNIVDQRQKPSNPIILRWYNEPSQPRYYQREMVDLALKHERGVLEAAVGCHRKGQKILMYDGTLKKVEDIVVGDLLMGPDSESRQVLELCRGKEQMYKIIPVKGDPFVVNGSHILSLQRTKLRGGDYGSRDIKKKRYTFKGHNPIKNISVNEYLNKSSNFKRNWKLYRTGVSFISQEVPLDPYLLGVWLGDGNSREWAITTMDSIIAKEFIDYTVKFNLNIKKCNRSTGKATTYFSRNKTPENNPIRKILKNLGVLKNKNIPNLYKINSKNIRLQLLAGLLDSDGHLNRNCYEITQKSERLTKDILFLCRSLGFSAYSKKVKKRCVNNNTWGTYYRINISGEGLDKIPARLARKKAKPRNQIKSTLRTGFTVQKLEAEKYYGFKLSGDRLYLLDDFTVTHNSGKTLTAAYIIKELSQRTLIIVPSSKLKDQIYNEMLLCFGARKVQIVESADITKNKSKLKDVRIVTIQTLASLQKQNLLKKVTGDVDVLIMDEFHHAASITFSNLLPEIENIYYRFGFTGTFTRNDSKLLELWGFLSKRLYHYPAYKATEEGYLTEVEYNIYNLSGNSASNYRKEYDANYCGSPELLSWIYNLMTKVVPENEQVLILVDQKEKAGEVIHKFLSKNNIENTYISGDNKNKETNLAIDDFNEKRIRVLVATGVLGEGIDLKSTQHLVLAGGGKSEIKLVQAIGRAVRLFPDKPKSYVYDCNFIGTKYLEKHTAARKSVFKNHFSGRINEE